MTSIDLSKPTSPPRRGDARPVPRAAPCAGLFGWRKGEAPARPAEGAPPKPGHDYPAG